jgi:dipeptidyl aminopeptidase/acylaminoacyl peptidase
MNRFLAAVVLFLLSALAKPLIARKPPKTDAPKLLTPEASLNLNSISDLQFTPDGNRLAFVVTEPPKGERRARHIWIYNKQSGAIRQFTYSGKTESSPRWSPDGKELAFLSDRDDDQQVYVMRSSGGEAVALTKGKRSVQNFAWSPDGKQIAFLAPDAKTEAEEKKEKDKDDARVVDKEDKQARLWLLTLATGEAKALTEPNWKIDELAWLPGGDHVIVSATDHPESDEHTNRIFSVLVSDGTIKPLAAPRGPFTEVRVSPDGQTVSYVGCREDGPTAHDLLLLNLGRTAVRNLTGASVDLPVFEYQWTKDGGLLAVVADGFRSKFVAFTAEGSLKEARNIPTNPGALAASNSGEVIFVGHSATTPQELWFWDQKSEPRQISDLNDSWKQYTLSVPKFYKYKSFDGLEIEAALLNPLGYDGKSKVALIALIHGGPTGNWQDSLEAWGQLLAARGYAVFISQYPRVHRLRREIH